MNPHAFRVFPRAFACLSLLAAAAATQPARAQSPVVAVGATHPQLAAAEQALAAGRIAEAEQLARTVTTSAPDERTRVQAFAIAGQAALKRGDFPTAADALGRALAAPAVLGAAKGPLALALATAHRGQGNLEAARGALEPVVGDLQGMDRATAFEIMAEAALSKNEDARAAQALARAWRATDLDGQLRLRALAQRLGGSNDAVELRLALDALKPSDFPAGHIAAKLAERDFDAGNPKQAAEWLERTKEAIGLDPALGVRVGALRARIDAAASTPIPPPRPPTPPTPPTPPPSEDDDAFPPAPPSSTPPSATPPTTPSPTTPSPVVSPVPQPAVPPPIVAPAPQPQPAYPQPQPAYPQPQPAYPQPQPAYPQPQPAYPQPQPQPAYPQPQPAYPQPQPAYPQPQPATPPTPASTLSAADAQRLARAIRQTGPTTWQIDRAFAEGVFNQSEPLGRCTRIYDESQGYRIMCVEPGGLFERMGLRQGDILMQVNEHSLNNPITVFLALGSIRSAPQLVARILRGGQVLVHTYNIQ